MAASVTRKCPHKKENMALLRLCPCAERQSSRGGAIVELGFEAINSGGLLFEERARPSGQYSQTSGQQPRHEEYDAASAGRRFQDGAADYEGKAKHEHGRCQAEQMSKIDHGPRSPSWN
jgi:hypothetical protein